VNLHVADETARANVAQLLSQAADNESVAAVLLVRGQNEPVQTRRRYMLIGQTLDGMRVWDILRGVAVLSCHSRTATLPIAATASGRQTSNLMLAALFEPLLGKVSLPDPREFPTDADYLNLDRFTSLESVRQRLRDTGQLLEEFESENP